MNRDMTAVGSFHLQSGILLKDGISPVDSNAASESPQPSGGNKMIYVRISIPDVNAQKSLQFHLDEPVWVAKEQVISQIGTNLVDAMNYGLYWPPVNGRSGKFLQEERPLKDYPLQGPVSLLEFRYKCRDYPNLQISATKLKKLQSKANRKQFMESVKLGDVTKVTRWLNKGLDPNFHSSRDGETPLTMAARREKPCELLIALASGGAHLDYRSRDSLTPLHKAAFCGNYEAIRTLLDLGQNPNCKDNHGLTPLYYTVLYDTRANCAERLLYDHSVIGVEDENGLEEIHQACRFGRVQHLEYLIAYGADLDARTKNGNTGLHICALTNQEACARLLMFRGSNRKLVNNAGQSAEQAAMDSGNQSIADLIRGFRDADIVILKELPKFNSNRRSDVPSLRNYMRCSSLNRLPNPYGESSASSGSMMTASVIGMKNGCHIPIRGSEGGPVTMMINGNTVGDSNCDVTTPTSSVVSSIGTNDGRLGTSANMAFSKSVTNLAYGSSPATVTGTGWESANDAGIRTQPRHTRSSILPFLTADLTNLPRTVVMQKGPNGYGFNLRGSRNVGADDFVPTMENPGRQYLEEIQPGSPADMAGLKSGDFVLEINSHPVGTASHDQAVQLIRDAGEILALKVITVDSKSTRQSQVLDQLDDTLAQFDDYHSLHGLSGSATPIISARQFADASSDKWGSVRSDATASNSYSVPSKPASSAGSGPPTIRQDVLGRTYTDENEIKAKMRSNAALAQAAEVPISHATPLRSGLIAMATPTVVSTPSNPSPSPSVCQSSPKRTAPPPPQRGSSYMPQGAVPVAVPVVPTAVKGDVCGMNAVPVVPTAVKGDVYWMSAETVPSAGELANQNPASRRSSGPVAVATISAQIVQPPISDPTPDYSDDSDVEPTPPTISIESRQRTVAPSLSEIREPTTVHQLQHAPHPKLNNGSAVVVPAPPLAPPPPPPPAPPPPPPPPASLAFSIQRPTKSDALPDTLSDHDANLKAAIANRRRRLEDGSTDVEQMDNKVQSSRANTKTMVFGAGGTVIDSPTASSPRQSRSSDTIITPAPVAPSQFFFTSSSPAFPAPAAKPLPSTPAPKSAPPAPPPQTTAAPAAKPLPSAPAPAPAPKSVPPAPAPKSAPPAPAPAPKPAPPATPPPTTTAPAGSSSPMNLRAQAEQLRQQVLLKRQSTDFNGSPSSKVNGQPTAAAPTPKLKPSITPKPIVAALPAKMATSPSLANGTPPQLPKTTTTTAAPPVASGKSSMLFFAAGSRPS